ncbi:hypothetical protein PZ938_18930 [Luteipulveratus sp. YIM 133132]|uniref:hypothetical protein n=1 Tax=Luteipulveratus flavus TaxID=3031728 RepID=UPI0023AFBD39|nr:hypothetical protein [Luteipulveratus sp. YIM 133132]MDE9367697.1 hypothetical protein [Luteipulveratus sp. YIM 133132]
MKGDSPGQHHGTPASRAAGAEVRRLAGSPAVQRIAGRVRDAARQTATRIPRADVTVRLRSADLRGVRTSDVLVDGVEARAARRTARSLGLSRTLDDTSAWAALGALAALMRVADDGRRRAVVLDASGPRSLFSRWATRAGFAPVHLDVTRPDVVGTSIDAGTVDLFARIHPRSLRADEADVDLVIGSTALRRGGLMAVTLRLGPAAEGGVGVAELRALVARADEQGLSLVGELGVADGLRLRAAQRVEGDTSVGLALLTFRRR